MYDVWCYDSVGMHIDSRLEITKNALPIVLPMTHNVYEIIPIGPMIYYCTHLSQHEYTNKAVARKKSTEI